MTTFTAIDGSTVTPRTRADLMKHPAFADLGTDTEGNPCVWQNEYSCQSCTSEQIDWADEWSCGCDDECPKCGKSHSPNDQTWLPNCDIFGPEKLLWQALPEKGDKEGEAAYLAKLESIAQIETVGPEGQRIVQPVRASGGVWLGDDTLQHRRETATILAALRYWQRWEGFLTGCAENAIATDGGEIEPLTAEEIDALCERLNT